MINATVAGNIGQDAELRPIPGGDQVLNFSVASTTKQKDGEQTTWVRCALFGKRGAALAPYLTKGSRVTVAGTLSTREYDGRSGKGFSLEMRVNDVALQGGGKQTASESSAPTQAARSKASAPPADDAGEWNRQPGDDDIPY